SKGKPAGYVGTFFIGLGFAAGWTPCIGPIFGSILILAASNPGQGLFYTVMYVIGFALPFFVLTFFLGSTKWIVKHSGIIMKFRSEEHTSELQSRFDVVCRLLLENELE